MDFKQHLPECAERTRTNEICAETGSVQFQKPRRWKDSIIDTPNLNAIPMCVKPNKNLHLSETINTTVMLGWYSKESKLLYYGIKILSIKK